MYCTNCGAVISDDAAFCTNCGAKVEKTENANSAQASFEAQYAAQPVYTAPVSKEDPEKAQSILTKAILAIVFACIPYISFLGIIFGAIGKKKAKAYEAEFGILSGKAKVGAILSKVGLILGIVLTIIYILAFIIGIVIGIYSY